ncbi:hypothetical protein [Tenacibaculum soleae]|uniref:hypothetical protein n=1 Tax=Tenacibaculum soleae TaxID=447689 RepID=UPI0026E16029|nr:hypothetical protein [Tenacibaculum soleae]MDO6813823.1 hypothetical protein [Tenacibaculum soleae]
MKKIFFILFSLMLVANINAMVVYGTNHEDQTKTEHSATSISETAITNANFVYLSMEKEIHIKMSNGTNLKLIASNSLDAGRGNSSFSKINEDFKKELLNHINSSILKQKDELIIQRIKHFLPDFNLEEELKRKQPRFYQATKGNETHFMLKHQSSEIRIITFIRTPLDFKIDSDNCSASYSESYY